MGHTLTDEQVAELRRLEGEATPGPWGSCGGSLTATGGDLTRLRWYTTGGHRPEDARLIAAARNALPALLDERDALRAEVERLRRVAEAARALLATLPRCDRCDRPATRAWKRGAARFCDEHGVNVPEYPRAPALRALLAALGGSDA